MRKIKLGEVLELAIDAVPVDAGTVYPMAGVYSFGRGLFARGPLSGANTTYRAMHRLHVDDFVLSQLKAWEGALGRVSPEFDGWYLSPQFPTFRPLPSQIDIGYLDWYCKQPSTWERLRGVSRGMGARRDSISPARFLEMVICLPSLEEQRAIVARLDRMESAIREAQSHRQSAIEASSALERASLGMLLEPKPHWRELTIEAVCTAIIDNLHRNPVYADEGVACVRSPDVGWGTLNLDSARKTSEAEYIRRTVRGEPTAGDIVFVREGGGTGKAALVESGQRFSLGQRVMMLRPNTAEVMPQFFLYQMLSPLVQEAQIRPRILGSAAPHLNIGDLRRFRMFLPALDEQAKIVDRLSGLSRLATTLQAHQTEIAKELTALRMSTLNRAFAAP